MYKKAIERSSFRQHVFYSIPIPRMEDPLELFLVQPPKHLETKLVVLQIRLTGHYSSFHEEDFLPSCLRSLIFGKDRLAIVEDLMTDRHISYNPSVHIDTCCLYNYSLCSLVLNEQLDGRLEENKDPLCVDFHPFLTLSSAKPTPLSLYSQRDTMFSPTFDSNC